MPSSTPVASCLLLITVLLSALLSTGHADAARVNPKGAGHSTLVDVLVSRGSNVSSSIDIKVTPAKGRHVAATADIPAGQAIYATPWRNMILGHGTADLSAEQDLMRNVLQARRDTDRGVGEWGPYVSELPKQYLNGLTFREAAACLSQSAAAQRQHLESEYAAAKLALGSEAEEGSEGSEARLLWAFSTVLTRAIRIPEGCVGAGGAALVPFFDFFNHNSTGVNLGIDYTEEGLSLSALRDIAAGEELLLDYGAHLTPTKLLIHYGFADASFGKVNSYLAFPDTPETRPLKEAGCLEAQDTGSASQKPFPSIYVAADGSLSPKLVECVTLSVLPKAERFAYTGLSEVEAGEVLAEKRTVALSVYGQHLMRVLSTYPSSDDEKCKPVANGRNGSAEAAAGEEGEPTALEVISASNDILRAVYLKAKQLIDSEVRESGMHVRDVVTGQAEKDRQARLRRLRRRKLEDEEDDDEEEDL